MNDKAQHEDDPVDGAGPAADPAAEHGQAREKMADVSSETDSDTQSDVGSEADPDALRAALRVGPVAPDLHDLREVAPVDEVPHHTLCDTELDGSVAPLGPADPDAALPRLSEAGTSASARPRAGEELPAAQDFGQVSGAGAKAAAIDAAIDPVAIGPVLPGPDGPFCPIAARKARRRRHLKWHLSIWTVVLALCAVLFAILVSMSVSGRVITLPHAVTARLEAAINAQTNRADLSLGRVEFGVSPRGIPRLRMVDVGVRDQTGLEVARLNMVEGGLRLKDALRGQLKPAWLRLAGAQITLRRRANGDFDLSFGSGSGASGDLATILDQIDREFTEGTLSGIEDISTRALTITLEDARSGRLWQVTDGQLKVTHNAEAVDISVSFDVFNQTEELAEMVLGFRAFKGRSGASMTATFRNARATDIAAQSPVMAFLSVVDAPISGALHSVISDAGQIEDLAGTLEFGQGAVTPGAGVQPIRFEGGKVYMDYNPERERIDFTEISVETDWGKARVSGHAYLRGWERGWPAEMLGQMVLSSAKISPPDMFETPVELDEGGADFRLRLDPFTLELGAFSMRQAGVSKGASLSGRGRAVARATGWELALDVSAERVTPTQLLAFWPLGKGVKTRTWIRDNLKSGGLDDVTAAVRQMPGKDPVLALSSAFSDMTANVVRGMVPIEGVSGRLFIENNQLVIAADKGGVQPHGQATIDISGTRFVVLDMKTKPSPARVDLQMRGAVPAALALLNAPPYRIFRHSKTVGADVVGAGQFDLTGQVDLRLKKKQAPGEVQYDLRATLHGATSETLIKGRRLHLANGRLTASNDGIDLTGRGALGAAAMSMHWTLPLDPKTGRAAGASRVKGQLPLDQVLLEELKVGLPKGTTSGRGVLEYDLTLAPGKPPQLTARSDLTGVGLSIGALGWSKPKAAKGGLRIEAELGTPARIPVLELSAPGLSAKGAVLLNTDNSFATARFDRVKLGGWLDAPVILTGRGKGRPPAVSVTGGSVDMRKATLGSGKGGAVKGAVPIDLILDRLVISSGITLTNFDGKFQQNNGTSGTFRARVAGQAGISGVVAPQANGTAIRITSSDAGGVLRAADVFKSAVGGKMELVLAPGGARGTYEGELSVEDVSVKDAPAMAELLSAVSVVGLLQQLGGQGIRFGEVEARFRLDPEKVTIYRSSAVGHSMGISMDGYYHLGSRQMEMQGVISPFYIINSAGRALARKGEGLIGFNYSLNGPPENVDVNVNLLSLFTPGIFRDIFRRKPPPTRATNAP